jgi:hypothetical protein
LHAEFRAKTSTTSEAPTNLYTLELFNITARSRYYLLYVDPDFQQ